MSACSRKACPWPAEDDGLCLPHLRERDNPVIFERADLGDHGGKTGNGTGGYTGGRRPQMGRCSPHKWTPELVGELHSAWLEKLDGNEERLRRMARQTGLKVKTLTNRIVILGWSARVQ